jgi:TATA-box binding protein (TBP) (component of TFIID and TFIIIB)
MLAKPVKEIRLSTRSAVHDLKGKVNYHKLCRELPNVSYEPEIFHAALLKSGSINFTIFQSGKVCITGIKTSEDEDDIVMPILLELELCVF